jgi:hypothetical protein
MAVRVDPEASKFRVALVSCVKSKRTSASPACELYTSALFRGLRRYAEANAEAWYILSAEHGLLSPSDVVAPYEKSLLRMPRPERDEWARRVRQQLLTVLPAHADVLLLAGARYREGIEQFLKDQGCRVTVPMAGLGIGKQLKWLKERDVVSDAR